MAALPASQPAMTTRTAQDRAAGESTRRTTRAAYTALGWVVLFFAFHVYCYLGGSFASPGKLPGGPHTLLAWIFEIFVAGAFPLGACVCLATARGWAGGIIFGLLAVHYRAQQARTHDDARPACRSQLVSRL